VKYPVNEGEVNLLYVAATRAKKVLQLNGVVEEVLKLKL
jgi:ATP-dependent exoDNAse (exonuclease V) alpha subunit